MSSAQLEPLPEPFDDILGPDPTLFALQDPQALKEQVAARTIQAAPGDTASARPVGEPADRTPTQS